MQAGVALEAGHMMMERDPLTDLEFRYSRPDSNDGPRSLMTKNPGRRHRAKFNFLDISRTDSANGHLDEQFIRTNRRHWHGLKPQVFPAAIHYRPHGLRNPEHPAW